MDSVVFSVDQIKTIAFNALSDAVVFDEVLAQNFHGMKMLISALESEAMSIADLPVTETEPPAQKPEEKQKKEPGQFAGYGAKLKKQTFDRLKKARQEGVKMSVIASKAKGLTDAEVQAALNAAKLPFERWELIASALDVLDKEEKSGQ